MAFKVTDEAMDILDGMSPEARKKFLRKLSSEQRQEVIAYGPKWKAKRTAPREELDGGEMVLDSTPNEPSYLKALGLEIPTNLAALQKDANFVTREVLGGKASLQPVQGVMNIVDPANAEERSGSAVDRYMQAKAFSNMNWAANQGKIEESGTANRAKDQMLESMGPAGAAGVSALLELGLDPTMLLPGGAAAKAGRGLASNYGRSVTATALTQGAAASLGAPEGQRGQAFQDAALDPMNLLLGAVGPLVQKRADIATRTSPSALPELPPELPPEVTVEALMREPTILDRPDRNQTASWRRPVAPPEVGRPETQASAIPEAIARADREMTAPYGMPDFAAKWDALRAAEADNARVMAEQGRVDSHKLEPVSSPRPETLSQFNLQQLMEMDPEVRAKMIDQKADVMSSRVKTMVEPPEDMGLPWKSSREDLAAKRQAERMAHQAELDAAVARTPESTNFASPAATNRKASLPSVLPEDLADTFIGDTWISRDAKTMGMEFSDLMKVSPDFARMAGGGGSAFGPEMKKFMAERAAKKKLMDESRTSSAPPQPPRPPKQAPPEIDLSDDVSEAVKTQMRIDKELGKGLLDRAKREFLLPEFRTDLVAAQAAIRGRRAADLIKDVVSKRIYDEAKAVMGTLNRQQRSAVGRFIAQQKNPLRDYGDQKISLEMLPPEWQNLWKRTRQEMDHRRLYLIRKGAFSAEQLEHMLEVEKRGFEWMTRDYAKFMAGGWKPSKAKRESAVSWFKREHGLKTADAIQAVDDLLGTFKSTDPGAAWNAWRMNRGITKLKSDMPHVLRELLGEIKDPAYVLASSAAEIDALHNQYKIADEFLTDEFKGVLWSDQRPANLRMYQVENDPKKFGAFAGKFLEPALWEAVTDSSSKQQVNMIAEVANHLAFPFRVAKITLNHVAWVNNFMGNFFFATAAGTPPWRHVPRLAQAFKAFNAFGSAKGLAQVSTGEGKWVQWAFEDGAIPNGLGEEAGGSQMRAIAKELARLEAAPTTGVGKALNHIWGVLEKSNAKLGAGYDLLDKSHRLATYIEQVNQGIDRLGLSEREARWRASSIVNANYPSSGTTGKGVKKLSQLAGFVNPIGLSFHVDTLRVYHGWMQSAVKRKSTAGQNAAIISGQGAAMALRVATWIGAIKAIEAGVRNLTGVTDEENEAALAAMKHTDDKFTGWAGFVGMKDEKGRYEILKYDATTPVATFLKGDPNRNVLSRVVGNVLGGFAGPLIEDGMNEALSKFGLGDKPFRPLDVPLTWKEKVKQGLWEYATPGSVQAVYNAGRKAEMWGSIKPTEEPFTPFQAALAAAGSSVRIIPAGQRSKIADLRGMKGANSETARIMSKVKKDTTLTPEDRRAKLKLLNQEKLERIKRRSP